MCAPLPKIYETWSSEKMNGKVNLNIIQLKLAVSKWNGNTFVFKLNKKFN